jgi:hypothetical protein
VPRGGRRSGTQGKAYASRTDLAMPMMAAPGQQYGKVTEQMDAQRALPMARAATDIPPAPSQAPRAAAAAPPVPLPGQLTSLDAPTQRPTEPITAGLDIGPGPGPEALGELGGYAGDDVGMELRAIYSRFPTEDLRRVLEMLDTDDGTGRS